MRTSWRSRVSLLLAALVGATTLGVALPAAAAELPDVVINEVETDGGSPDDWIELKNRTDAEIDVSGWWVEDSGEAPEQLEGDYVIPAGGYLVLVSKADFSFGLGKDEVITIYLPDGETVVDTASFPGDHAPTTFGRCADGEGDFVVTASPTKGAENDCPRAAAVMVINEIESSGGTPGDWIELKNTGGAAVDAGGLQLLDGDTSHAKYVIPDDTIVEAGGYLVIEEAQFGWGLGADNDSVTLFDTDGTTVVQSHTWTTGTPTTIGRCPDGAGPFEDTAAPTKGAANDCSEVVTPDIVINELDTDPDDWVELLNLGEEDVDLEGWWVQDSNNAAEQLVGEYLVPAGGYLVLEGEGADFATGLGREDAFHLIYSDGFTEVDSYSWSDGHPAESYSRCPDGTGAFIHTPNPTPGAANDCDLTLDPADWIVLNEIESNGGTPGDWIELYNTADQELDAGGLQLLDGDTSHAKYVIPDDTIVEAGGYLVIEEAQFDWGLGAPETVTLFDTDGSTVIQSYSWTAHADESYGRCPDGVGPFTPTESTTKGAANHCPPFVAPSVAINEIESNGDVRDWIEFYNYGTSTVDLSGYRFQDNDPSHDFYVFPDGFELAPGEFFVIHGDTPEEFPHGLGNDDSAILYAPDGVTVVDSHSWGPHAATTYGRCPDGTGEFVTQTTATKGAANDCGPAIVINEIESSDPADGPDWIELGNAGGAPVELTGWTVKDADDDHSHVLPATTLAAGAYLLLEEGADFDFGLGGGDSVRLFDADGVLVDEHVWGSHAPTTYGRCPNLTGDFAVTSEPTPGATNVCPGDVPVAAWPGGASVVEVDEAGYFGEDMSGLVYEGSGTGAPGILWAVNNDSGKLYKLGWDGAVWAPVTADGWADGKVVRYPGGTGTVDAEGVTILGGSSASGVYIASERNNSASSVSRPSILRVDVTGSATELVATDEWNLADDLALDIPTLGANAGLEGIAWISDSYLVENDFVDESTDELYDPLDYPGHGGGLFFVAVEQDGGVYGYALTGDGDIDRVTRFDSGFPGAMELVFDVERQALWVVCDEVCEGRSALFTIDETGRFTADVVYARPASAPDLANEGFAIAPQAECVDGLKPVFWADDAGTGGHALRAGTIECTELGGGDPGDPGEEPGEDPVPPSEEDLGPGNAGDVEGPSSGTAGSTITITVGVEYAGEEVDVWLFSTPVHLGTHVVSALGTIQVTIPASMAPGIHRLAIVDADGEIIGWYELEVLAAGPTALGETGGESGGAEWLALGLLAAGVLLLAARRRRVAI